MTRYEGPIKAGMKYFSVGKERTIYSQDLKSPLIVESFRDNTRPIQKPKEDDTEAWKLFALDEPPSKRQNIFKLGQVYGFWTYYGNNAYKSIVLKVVEVFNSEGVPAITGRSLSGELCAEKNILWSPIVNDLWLDYAVLLFDTSETDAPEIIRRKSLTRLRFHA